MGELTAVLRILRVVIEQSDQELGDPGAGPRARRASYLRGFTRVAAQAPAVGPRVADVPGRAEQVFWTHEFA